jgi:hypothetical protein
VFFESPRAIAYRLANSLSCKSIIKETNLPRRIKKAAGRGTATLPAALFGGN